MYADRYFPARYFPNRYFGTTADAGAPALLSVYANPRSDAATIGDYDGDDAGHIAAYARAMLAGSDFL